MERIPNELLAQILGHLRNPLPTPWVVCEKTPHQADLATCMRVSIRFQHVTAPILHRVLVVSNYHALAYGLDPAALPISDLSIRSFDRGNDGKRLSKQQCMDLIRRLYIEDPPWHDNDYHRALRASRDGIRTVYAVESAPDMMDSLHLVAARQWAVDMMPSSCQALGVIGASLAYKSVLDNGNTENGNDGAPPSDTRSHRNLVVYMAAFSRRITSPQSYEPPQSDDADISDDALDFQSCLTALNDSLHAFIASTKPIKVCVRLSPSTLIGLCWKGSLNHHDALRDTMFNFHWNRMPHRYIRYPPRTRFLIHRLVFPSAVSLDHIDEHQTVAANRFFHPIWGVGRILSGLHQSTSASDYAVDLDARFSVQYPGPEVSKLDGGIRQAVKHLSRRQGLVRFTGGSISEDIWFQNWEHWAKTQVEQSSREGLRIKIQRWDGVCGNCGASL